MAQNCFSLKHPIPNRKNDVALALPVVTGKFPFALGAHSFCCCSNDCKVKFFQFINFIDFSFGISNHFLPNNGRS